MNELQLIGLLGLSIFTLSYWLGIAVEKLANTFKEDANHEESE